MRLIIASVGRLKQWPEAELASRYLDRADALGRKLGLTLSQQESVEGRGERASERRASEAQALRKLIPEGAILIALDERGENLTSEQFAQSLWLWRDGGEKSVAFLLGGPDGLAGELRGQARQTIAFGAMTWPHQFARIMLAEQLYRALAILSGHPYHRA